jgi:hypothetical protein
MLACTYGNVERVFSDDISAAKAAAAILHQCRSAWKVTTRIAMISKVASAAIHLSPLLGLSSLDWLGMMMCSFNLQ